MTPKTKPWYQSMTVWVNLVSLAVGVEQQVANNAWVQANPEAVKLFAGAIVATNLFLRILKTDSAIS